MYPEDVEQLIGLVSINTKVNLIDQTTKVGWQRGTLYGVTPLEGTDNPRDMDPALMDADHGSGCRPQRRGRLASVRRVFEQSTGVPVPCPHPCARCASRDSRSSKKTPRRAAASPSNCNIAERCPPIDFWNARSIFSLFASQQACAALAAWPAWLAVLFAMAAASAAALAASAAALAVLLAAAASCCAALMAASEAATCSLNFDSLTQPARATAAAATVRTLAMALRFHPGDRVPKATMPLGEPVGG
jgi:hypothetical protein